MAKAEVKEVVDVSKNAFWKALTDYDNFPKFVTNCKKTESKREDANRVRVKYQVNLMKEVEYTLEHLEDSAAGRVTWKLLESSFMTKNEGLWELREIAPGKTEVRHSLEIEFTFPAPGFIVSRLIKNNLPEMIRDYAKRAKEMGT